MKTQHDYSVILVRPDHREPQIVIHVRATVHDHAGTAREQLDDHLRAHYPEMVHDRWEILRIEQ